jgi:erythromycin esterase
MTNMKHKLIVVTLVSIFLSHVLFGQTTEKNSLRKYTHEITSISSDNFEDLQFLKNEIGKKRIVLLGENSHTVGDYYQLKTRIVKYLHQECGFEIFAMESGLADVYTIYQQADSLTGSQLMDKTLFANQSCNEMKPLFDYIKNSTKHKLHYCGFDSQNHVSSLKLIKSILHEYYGNTSDSLVSNLSKYYNIPQLLWQEDKKPLSLLSDTIVSSANALIQMLQSIKEKVLQNKTLSEIHYKFLERSLFNHKDAVNLNWNIDNPMERRDSLMAENLLWLAQEIYPNKKIIVWAHNTHIDKGGTDAINRSMGFFINNKLPNNTYHLGIYAKTGELYWWWTKEKKPINSTDSNDIESFADLYPITFLKTSKRCKALTKIFMGYEAEFGRKVKFIPEKRYDAIINFRTVKASSY